MLHQTITLKSNSKVAMLKLIVLACLMPVLIVCAETKNSPPKRSDSSFVPTPGESSLAQTEATIAVQGFVEALRDHDVTRAYYAFTTRNFRSVTSRTGFQTFVYGNAVLNKNATADFSQPVPQGDLLIMKTTMSSIDGQKSIVEFALKQEDNKWRILGIKIFPTQ